MIARTRAWLGARKQLNEEIDFQVTKAAERDEVIARLTKLLAAEKFVSARLDAEVKRLVQQVNALGFRIDSAVAEADRLRAEATYVAAKRCECGGDAELHWRTRAVAAEAQAGRDRANALALTDRLADAEGREVSAGYVR